MISMPDILAKVNRLTWPEGSIPVFDRVSGYFRWIGKHEPLPPNAEHIPGLDLEADRPPIPHATTPPVDGVATESIAKDERARLRAILLDSPESRDERRFAYLAQIALDTDLAPAAILEMTRSAVPKRSYFSEAMGLLNNPQVGVDAGNPGPGETEAAFIQNGVNLLPPDRRASTNQPTPEIPK